MDGRNATIPEHSPPAFQAHGEKPGRAKRLGRPSIAGVGPRGWSAVSGVDYWWRQLVGPKTAGNPLRRMVLCHAGLCRIIFSFQVKLVMKESVPVGRSAPDPYGTIPRVAPKPETLGISPPAATVDVRDMIFGRLALLHGLVDQETLDKARAEQSTYPSKTLAEVLLESGAFSAADKIALEYLLKGTWRS
jgi:hypothetical protein